MLDSAKDKTALASLILGSRYRPLYVFAGVAAAFAVHAALAVAAGSLLALLPRRPVEIAVAVLVAEFGDLTQIATASLAARFHDPLSVGIGAVLALWAVAVLISLPLATESPTRKSACHDPAAFLVAGGPARALGEHAVRAADAGIRLASR
jgi:putative Ca2+/H+ antiporter (TMEM165/GDT1 family)